MALLPAGMTFLVLVLALGLDAAAGYPDRVYRSIGHPVSWIGALIGRLDRGLNDPETSSAVRKARGALALAFVVIAAAAIAYLLQCLLLRLPFAPLLLAIPATMLLAARSLHDHVSRVAVALETHGLASGRAVVGQIVGRNTEALDEHGVARAAIESLAENASDGVVAPVFWFAVLGLPGLVAYKAINTADSMIGHLTPRHADFGWAAARLDDLVNLPASRLTGLLLAAAAALLSGASAQEALRSMTRDASRHRSPNAGWPEAAMAGALGLKLNGPKVYDGAQIDDAYMGDGRRDATVRDIRAALTLSTVAWAILVCALAGLAFIARA